MSEKFYFDKYLKYKKKYFDLVSIQNNNATTQYFVGGKEPKKYAIFMLCMISNKYVVGACINAYLHKKFLKRRNEYEKYNEHDTDIVIMCDDYIYDNYHDLLEPYFDKIIKIEMKRHGKYTRMTIDRYSWLNYSLNKWQCLKFVEYEKILFIDVDSLVCDKDFYNVFDYNTPAILNILPKGDGWSYIKNEKCDNIQPIDYPNCNPVNYFDYLNNIDCGSMSGSMALFKPSIDEYNNFFETYDEFFKDVLYLRPDIGAFGVDERSLFYYYMNNKIPVYNICPWYHIAPEIEKDELFEKYHSVAKSYDYAYRIKSWEKPLFLTKKRDMPWYLVFKNMNKSEKFMKLYYELVSKNIDEYFGLTKRTKFREYSLFFLKKNNVRPEEILRKGMGEKDIKKLEKMLVGNGKMNTFAGDEIDNIKIGEMKEVLALR